MKAWTPRTVAARLVHAPPSLAARGSRAAAGRRTQGGQSASEDHNHNHHNTVDFSFFFGFRLPVAPFPFLGGGSASEWLLVGGSYVACRVWPLWEAMSWMCCRPVVVEEIEGGN